MYPHAIIAGKLDEGRLQMKTQITAILLLAAALGGGCTYKGVAQPVPAKDVLLSYDDPIPGKWALVVSANGFLVEAEHVGYGCTGHTYQIDAESSFVQSVPPTLRQVFESLDEVDSELSGSAMLNDDYSGQIVVTGDRMEVTAGPTGQGFRSEAEISAKVVVKSPDHRLIGTRLTADGDNSGGGGFACNDSPAIMESAVEEAIKSLMEEMAEEIGNSERLREYTLS